MTVPADETDPVVVRHRDLEEIAMAALKAGRLLMECGARASLVDSCVVRLARALGAETAETRAGYASLSITVRHGQNTITRMIAVGRHGVNQQLDRALRALVGRVQQTPMRPGEVLAEIDRLVRATPHNPHWLIAVAVGVACASFGRLLGADWAAFGPVLACSGVAQYLRGAALRRGVNVFVVALLVAFVASLLSGLGAMLAGSGTVDTAMIASILLLVPGVPLLNAQSDILEGRPTLGSARGVTVLMIMIFATTGLWLSGLVLGTGIAR